MKRSSTKGALYTSFIALVLCCTMLLGTTFAWFTDEVTSTNNIIQSGSLDVEFEYSTDMSTWDKVEPTTNIFKKDALWEPGYAEVVYFKVTNVGDLALKYQLGVSIANEKEGTNKAGESFKLSDYIEYGVVPGVTEDYADRATAIEAVTEPIKLNKDTMINDSIIAKTATTPAVEKTYALVVYMPEEVGNVANHKVGDDAAYKPEINLGIKVFATQDTVEIDSFGPDYDDVAWVAANADAIVNNESELTAALQEGGLIALAADINEDISLENIADNTIVNFAGNTINGTVTVAEGQSITLNGVGGVNATGTAPAIKLGKNTNVILAGGTYTSEDAAINIANEKSESPMNITIEEGTVITAPTIIWLDSMKGYAGAEIVINGGEFNSTYEKSDARPIKVHGGNVTINGGTFTIDNPTGKNCYFVDVSSKYNTETKKYEVGNAVINGGTFKSNVPYTRAVFASMSSTHIPGTVEINGGTFEFTASNSYLVDAPSNVVVNDCTYIGINAACVFNVSSTNPADLTITVNGGNYTVRNSPRGSFVTSTYANRLILKGGTINSNKYIDGSLADGYKLVDNGNDTYSIVAK